MHKVYLQLGTNLGDKKNHLKNAISHIDNIIGDVVLKSKIYESAPWGVKEQNNYLNQVLLVESKLSPNCLLKKILEIEKKMGRIRIKKWEERIIDIDILFYNNSIIETSNLCIPHKYLHERLFVLKPLGEIAPEFKHPKYESTISELIDCCIDVEKVEEYEI